MSLFEVGRLVLKVAGRDAGRKGVVVEQFDDGHVLIDGGVRRRKVKVRHLEPLEQVLEITKGASHEKIAQEFEKIQLPVWNTKPKLVSPRAEKKRKGKKALVAAPVREAVVAVPEEKPKKRIVKKKMEEG